MYIWLTSLSSMSFLLVAKRGCDMARRRVKCNQEAYKRNVIEKLSSYAEKKSSQIWQKVMKGFMKTKNSLPAWFTFIKQ